ncbi:MAG: Nif3-like dinuclear metal center hexameric protein [Clostridia bacterium]|nr:Nif3-like dinuclear metal center hexameric protein [Clostridia bacterium]
MTVKELYARMTARIPESLRESWDNDGIMCAPDLSADVHRVLLSLDVTEEVVDYAIENDFDLIISHHPLIFRPLAAFSEDNPCGRKLLKLSSNGITVFSFHTRADKVDGGVNDLLADTLDLHNVEKFGEGDLGRIGELDEEITLDDFAMLAREALGAPAVLVADGFNPVHKVAVVGGDGKDFIADALAAGADTFLSGRLSYNTMAEAGELGINLIEAGHYYTECRITEFFLGLVSRFVPDAFIEVADSNLLRMIN